MTRATPVFVLAAALLFFLVPSVLCNGDACLECTLIIGVLDQYADTHEVSIEQAMDDLCGFLPSELQPGCKALVEKYGDVIINLLSEGATPDEVCQGITLCADYKQCSLFTPKFDRTSLQHDRVGHMVEKTAGGFTQHHIGLSPWDWIKQELAEVFSSHIPPGVFDLDDDHFSTLHPLRGADWRGMDCGDTNSDVYPGRNVTNFSSNIDHNCNGVVGSSGSQTYESLLCANTGQMGTIVIGASAQAHFRIPPTWIEGQYINSTTYDDLIFAIENELDWPHLSWATGWDTSNPNTPVSSLYLKMREQNLCNHRDYQSISLNGAGSPHLIPLVQTMSRNQTHDQPALAVIATIGDDICGMNHDANHMTTPQEFQQNILTLLNTLDTKLPSGSHVLFMGLVDGRILWDTMNNLTHPIGRNITYAKIYEYLTCINANPCYLWLNSNQTLRDIGSARSAQLSAVYETIVANYTFKHFDMAYLPFPLEQIKQTWVANGGNPADLIEPVDGFHPSQVTHKLLADYVWQWLQKNYPSWIPLTNPNNAKILQLFGNQGGY
eukprot:TRINITY_DN3018_c0_g1_i3.p1 TRINITY_DN3018_c0_g1~~TRINITY_DN3018_c0_g1_i3.p1  ORF type:complete len:551 (-),score=134.63 TRINITY_DN3018_c0_g1_i3:319-1971(-)